MLGMKGGGVRELILGPDLAFGESGGGPVPDDATLCFEVQIVSVPWRSTRWFRSAVGNVVSTRSPYVCAALLFL
jgi:hypothetical protein